MQISSFKQLWRSCDQVQYIMASYIIITFYCHIVNRGCYCSFGDTFSLMFSTVWWAFVSGKSSSAGAGSRMDCPRSDSRWGPFWEQRACQRRTRDTTVKKRKKQKERWFWRLETAEWEKKDEEIHVFHVGYHRKKQFIMWTGCLRQWPGRRDEMYTWMSPDLSFKRIKWEMSW